MIGLPTSVTSRIVSSSMPASRGDLGRELARAPRARRRSSALRRPGSSSSRRRGSSGLRRSGSAGSCAPAEATTSPLDQVAQVRGDRGRADVDREAEGRLVEARPDGDDARCRRARRRSPSTRPRAARAAAAAAPRGRSRGRCSCHSRSSATSSRCRSPRRVVHVGLGDLDVVQPDERIRARCRAPRPPCARPAGAPGCRTARRRRRRPRPAPGRTAGGPRPAPCGVP